MPDRLRSKPSSSASNGWEFLLAGLQLRGEICVSLHWIIQVTYDIWTLYIYVHIYIYYIYILCTYIIYIYESVYDCHNSMARTENCSGFMDLLHDKSVRCKPLSFPRYGVQTRPSGGIVMSTQRESQSTGSQAVGFPGKRFPCRGMVGPGSLSELVDKVMFEFTACNTICSTIRILCWHCGTGLMICQKEIS